MTRRAFFAFSSLALLVVVLVITACGDSPTAPSRSGTLRLMLTDDIADVEAVFIHFTSVTAKPVGEEPPQELALDLDPNPVDLLTLADQVTAFAAGAVEPGAYEFIHINIDESQSRVVEGGVEKPLRVPSEEIKVVAGFTVEEDGTTTVTLDFDAGASLVPLGNGEWLLRPIIIVTQQGNGP